MWQAGSLRIGSVVALVGDVEHLGDAFDAKCPAKRKRAADAQIERQEIVADAGISRNELAVDDRPAGGCLDGR